jgi:hypothetical protein
VKNGRSIPSSEGQGWVKTRSEKIKVKSEKWTIKVLKRINKKRLQIFCSLFLLLRLYRTYFLLKSPS